MNSETLLQFLAVYRRRGIGRASRQMGVSQPAISNSIRRLEDELKVPLFCRTATGVEPTAYADALARRAEVISNELERARSEILGLRTLATGEVRFGVGPALASSLVSEALASFLNERPQLVASVLEGLFDKLTEGVESGRLDFAVTTNPSFSLSDELTSELLFGDQFRFVVRRDHPLARARTVQPADLISYPWVLPPRDGTLWSIVKTAFDGLGLELPQARVETNSGGCIKALLRSGTYVSLVPPYLVQREVEMNELVILSVPGIKIPWDVVVLRRAGSTPSPAADAFLAHLRQMLVEGESVAAESEGRS